MVQIYTYSQYEGLRCLPSNFLYILYLWTMFLMPKIFVKVTSMESSNTDHLAMISYM